MPLSAFLLLVSGLQAELPPAEEVLSAGAAALGTAGRATPRPLVARGTSSWGSEGTSGRLVQRYGGFGQVRSTTEYEQFGTFDVGSDGTFVWQESSLDVEIREGWDAAQHLRLLEIERDAPWTLLYEGARTIGREELDGHPCWVLELTARPLFSAEPTELPVTDVWHVDVESKLPRRVELRVPSPAGQEAGAIVAELDDWRAVDGVRYAHRLRVTISGFTVVLRFESIEHLSEVDPAPFRPSEEALAALQRRRDGTDAARDAAIVVETLEERLVASVRLEVAHVDMQKTLTVLFPEVMQAVLSQGRTMDGQPLVRYHSFGARTDLEAAIPVRTAIADQGRVKASTLPAGPAAVAWHVGPYDTLGEAYERLQAYLAEQGLEPAGAPWEEYWTDPGLEPDPARWRTRVLWPVRRRGE